MRIIGFLGKCELNHLLIRRSKKSAKLKLSSFSFSKIWLITKKSLITKKTSAPTKPLLNQVGNAWKPSKDKIAKPRRPSISAR